MDPDRGSRAALALPPLAARLGAPESPLALEIVMASSVAEAEPRATQRKWDLGIADVMLRDGNAPSTVSAIRAAAPGTPIDSMSGFSEVRLRDASIAIADPVFLQKPFQRAELLDAVERARGRAESDDRRDG